MNVFLKSFVAVDTRNTLSSRNRFCWRATCAWVRLPSCVRRGERGAGGGGEAKQKNMITLSPSFLATPSPAPRTSPTPTMLKRMLKRSAPKPIVSEPRASAATFSLPPLPPPEGGPVGTTGPPRR